MSSHTTIWEKVATVLVLAAMIILYGCVTGEGTPAAEPTEASKDAVELEGIPTGAVMFFNSRDCPDGWERLRDADGQDAGGRYLVALPDGGELGAIVGRELVGGEDRPVGQHSHAVNQAEHGHEVSDPGHTHIINPSGATVIVYGGWDAGGSQVPGPGAKQNVFGLVIQHSRTNITIRPAEADITIVEEGEVPGTNAPYLQLLACEKME